MTTWRLGTVAEANSILRDQHYLGPIKTGGIELVTIGHDGSRVVACQVWRKPTSRRLPATWLELSRWCLTADAGEYAGSRMHRHAVGLLRELRPDASTLVSYSDPSHGHTGALYRACNWIWAPTWIRLRPPPTGNGAWQPGKRQAIKDRWVFPLRKDPERWRPLLLDDFPAIRYWVANRDPSEIKWARGHPQLELAG